MLRLAFRPTAPLLTAARRLRHRSGTRDTRARATATSASSRIADKALTAAADERFMRLALREATLAASHMEVPVGAVLVDDKTGTVLASHHNSTSREDDPTAHAELKCIRDGAKKLGSWRLLAETTLYVTLEPCPMCAGGVLNARLGAVVWGAPNPLIGADGSWIDLMGDGGASGCGAEGVCDAVPDEEDDSSDEENTALRGGPLRPHAFKPTLEVRRRVLEEECGEIMRVFFRDRRDANKKDLMRRRSREAEK